MNQHPGKQALARLLTAFDLQVWKSLSPVERESFLAHLDAEGLAPLLYWNLSQSGEFSLLDAPDRERLRGAYFSTWQHNQRLLAEMTRLGEAFAQAGIPAVALKGACFALTIYPNIGLRPLGDLDLLIPAGKMDSALAIARGLGFGQSYPEAAPGLNDLLSHEVLLQKDGLFLELHHSLVADRAYVYAVPVDWFWSQTEPLQAPGGLLMLSPTAQVLYAAAHAMLQHGGHSAPLRWFYDLDRLLAVYAGRLDWTLLLSQAREFEWTSALAAALEQACELFETPLPPRVRLSLAGVVDRHQPLVALKQLPPATHILLESRKLRSLTWPARIRLFLALLAPSPAYMRWRYRLRYDFLLPYAYLRRWLGIAADGLRTLLAAIKPKSR